MEVLRYMDKPSRDGSSIDSADQYEEGIDVHNSIGVFNRLFYLIANTAGWDTRKASTISWLSEYGCWTPTTTFDEAGCGVINAAHDLDFQLKMSKKH